MTGDLFDTTHGEPVETKNGLPADLESQLPLFSLIPVSGNPTEETLNLSNVTGIYSMLPSSVPAQKKNSLDGSKPIERMWEHGSRKLKVHLQISPAVTIEHGTCFPGRMESKVELAICYLASQGCASISSDRSSIWVHFKLSQLRNTLRDNYGVTYANNDIRRSLAILSQSALTVTVSNQSQVAKYTSNRLSQLKELTENDNARISDLQLGFDPEYSAALHPLLVRDVQMGLFLPYHTKYMRHLSSDVAEMLYQRLSYYWRQASIENPYNFDGKEFMKGTTVGFDEKRSSRAFSTLRSGLEQLQKAGVLSYWEEVEHHEHRPGASRGRRKIRTIIFTVHSTESFQHDCMTANMVSKRQLETLKQRNTDMEGAAWLTSSIESKT